MSAKSMPYVYKTGVGSMHGSPIIGVMLLDVDQQCVNEVMLSVRHCKQRHPETAGLFTLL